MNPFEHFEQTLRAESRERHSLPLAEQIEAGLEDADLGKKQSTTITVSARLLEALREEATEQDRSTNAQVEAILRERYSLQRASLVE